MADKSGALRRVPVVGVLVLLAWAGLLRGCWQGSCENVRGQLAAVVVDCQQPGPLSFEVADCGCDCVEWHVQEWAAAQGCIWQLLADPPGAGSCVWHFEAMVGEEPPWPTATPDPRSTRLAEVEGTLVAVETQAAGVATMVYATMEACGRLGDCCASLTLTAAAPTPEPTWTAEVTPAPVDPARMCRLCVDELDCGDGYTCRDCAGAWRCVRSYFPSSDCATYCSGVGAEVTK